MRMRILQAVNFSAADTANPYIRSLVDGLRKAGHCVEWSADDFWTAEGRFDVVHIHWPQALFGWKIDDTDRECGERLRKKLVEIHDGGGVIFYTRHNSIPHDRSNPHSVELHEIMEKNCDVIVHLGEKSRQDCEDRYQDVKHCVIPHHAYDWYPRDIGKAQARKFLKLDGNTPVVLSFGVFRSKEERLLLAESCVGLGSKINLLAPMISIWANGKEDPAINLRVQNMLQGIFQKQRKGRVKDVDVPTYFGASDVVFIQRLDILNSGNLPLAFHFGKVVVGPDCGNVGEILRSTGNPTFDPSNPQSAIAALKVGLKLAAAGKGQENQRYADLNWGRDAIVARLEKVYYDEISSIAPFVSILMPSLNTARYIREALDSVVNQTLKNIEIICIDAGSTDGSREIIDEYAERDSRIRIIDSPVKSYGYQMNLGTAAAKGRYIGIVEPDDHVLPEMYEELYDKAIAEDADIVKGNCNLFMTDEDGAVVSKYCSIYPKWGVGNYGRLFDASDVPEAFREGTLGTWSGIYRRKLLLENHVRYSESAGASFQDTGFFFQTAICARRFMAVEKAYYNYRMDNPGSSRNDKSKLMVLWKEYEFLFNWLADYPDKRRLSVFEPYIHGRFFSGNFWLVEQIGLEPSKELVDMLKKKFLEAVAAGFVRQRHMPLHVWNTLVSWTKDDIPVSCSCKISIVIPCFNVARYIEACVDSILGQTLREWECLFVDDGSTDDTVEVIRKYAVKDSRIKLFEQPHTGVYEARNRAMREAKGEFLAFMDPDDLYPSQYVLSRLYEAAKHNGLLAAGGSFQTFTPDGKISRVQRPKNLFTKERTMSFSEYQWALGYQRFIFSRLLLQRMGIYFPPFTRFQDPPFMAAALIAAKEFRAIPDFVYSYRIGYKKIDWKADDCRRFRDALKGIGMLAKQAAQADLPELLACAERELDAHLNGFVKPDESMLALCAEEVSSVKETIASYCTEIIASKKKEKYNRVDKISILKIFLPYSFMRWWAARRYGYAWPECKGVKGALPFFLVSSLLDRTSMDRRIVKYLLPYGIMCDRLFTQYGYTQWNGVPLDGQHSSHPNKVISIRALSPFGMVLFLDKYSQK